MSGVIDGNGQQWEHCGCCNTFIRFPQNLGYEKPTKRWKYGRDICVKCVDKGIRAGEIEFENIVPAKEWRVYEE
jgi:hypothetical protein